MARIMKGRTSPSHDLEAAVGFLRGVRAKIGYSAVDKEMVSHALGHQSFGGASSVKIGSLTHFGLLDRKGKGHYAISDLGMKVLMPTNERERMDALELAALSPSLYQDVWDEFNGQALPDMLGNIVVRKYGVLPKNGEEVAQNFRATMQYAGLLQNGILGIARTRAHEEASDEPEGAATSDHAIGASPEPAHQVGPPVSAHLQPYAIPLAGKKMAVLQLPQSLKQSDVELIKAWIDLMKNVLIESAAEEDTSAAD